MRLSPVSIVDGWRAAILPLLAVWISVGVVRGQTVTETFDAAEDFTAYGSATSNATAVWTATGGRDGEGGVSVSRDSSTGYFNGWLPAPLDLTGKTTLHTSVLIHTGAWTNEATLYFGFANDAGNPPSGTSTFFSSGAYTGISVRLEYSTSSSGRFRLRFYNKAGSSSASSVGSEITLQNLNSGANAGTRNQWLRLNVTLVPHPTTANAYNAVATLEKLGASGSDAPVQIMTTGNQVITNASIFEATAAYSAHNLSIGSSNSGTTYLDDHRVTLEANVPSTAPTTTEAEVHTTTRLTAKWTAPVDAGLVSGYVLEFVKNGDAFESGNFIAANGAAGQAAGIAVAGPAVLSRAIIGLERNQAYQYRVRAANPAGAGPESNIIDVTTLDVNTPPTLSSIAGQAAIYPGDTTSRPVALAGIGHGGDDGQTLTVTAVSSDPAVVPHPSITYTSPDVTGTLTYTPTGEGGTATITVTVTDSGDGDNTFERTFAVTVQAQPGSLGFDSADDLTDYVDGAKTSNLNYAWSETAGKESGGGILVTRATSGSGTYSSWRKQPLNLVGKSNITTSILINASNWNNSSDLYLGFVVNAARTDGSPVPGDTTNFLVVGSNYRAIGVYLDYSNSNDRFQLTLRNKAGTSDAGSATPLGSVAPVTATYRQNWLRLSLSLVPSGAANSYSAVTTLEDLGPNGVSEPVTIATTSATLANEAIFTALRAYPAYNLVIGSSNNGSTRLDDHQASATTQVPAAPTALSATVVSRDAFNTNWVRPALSAVDGYLLELIAKDGSYDPGDPDASFVVGKLIDATGSVSGDGAFEGIPVGAALTTLRLEDLDYETTYLYRLRAYNGMGNGPASNVVELTTLPEDGNLQPTLGPISAPGHPLNPGVTYSIPLSGITTGGETDQDLEVVATSSDGEIVAASIVYSPNNSTGILQLAAGTIEGDATITVTVYDGPEDQLNRSASHSFGVTVRQPPSVVGFEDGADFGNYVTSQSSSGVATTWGADYGTGTPAGGGVRIAAASKDKTSANWIAQPYSLAGATSIKTSILVRLAGAAKKTYFGVGFTTAAPGSVTSSLDSFLIDGWSGSHVGMSASMRREGSKYEKLRVWNKSGTGSASELFEASDVNDSNLNDKWLRLSMVITPTGPSTGTVQHLLENLGPDGNSEPVTVRTQTETFTNAALLSSQSAYAAFNVSIEDEAGTVYVDDHRVEVLYTPPSAPVAGEATIILSDAFTSRWTPPSGVYYTGTRIEVSTSPDFDPDTFVSATGDHDQAGGVLVSGTAARSLRFTGLTPSTTYYYRVFTLAPAGASEASNTVEVATLELGENAQPTLDPVVFGLSRVGPGSGSYTANLAGITDGGEYLGDPADRQGLVVTVALDEDNLDVVTAASVEYASPDATGKIHFTVGETEGTANLSVTVTDVPVAGSGMVAKSITRTLAVTVHQPLPTVGFDASGDFSSEFSHLTTSNMGLVWGATNGAAGGGGLALTNGSTSDNRYVSAWRNQPYRLAGAETIETSILIKPSGWREKQRREQFRVGFTVRDGGGAPSGSDVLRSASTYRGVSAFLSNDLEEKDCFYLSLSNKAGTSSASQSSEVTIPDPSLKDQWLRLSLSLVPNGAGGFVGVARLHSLGGDGLSAPVLIANTAATTLTNAAVANATEAYAAFTFYQEKDQGGPIYLDDHFANVEYPILGPELTLEHPLNSELTSGLSVVHFGSLPAGGSAYREFVIRNSGSEELTGIAVQVVGANAASVVLGTPSATSLLIGETATLGVTLQNGAPGPLTATLRVTSAETAEPFEVALGAVGLATVQPGLSLSANPNVSLGRKLGVPGTDNGRSGGTLAASGNYVVAGSAGGMVSIHNPATGALTRNIAPPAGAGPEFGRSVAVFGNLVAIGSPLEDGTGAVYVFNAATGAQVFRAVPPAGEGGTRFGQSVGLNKDVLAVGDPTATGGGGAYLYDLTWGIFLNYVLPSSSSAGQEFGATLVVDGTQVLVGAPGETGGGAAYLFQIFDSSQIFRIASDDGASGDRFGVSLALDAQRIVAGAPGRYTGQGAAFVFSRSGGTLQQELIASDTTAGDAFGSAVALSAYGVLVGAAEKGAGVTYVFNASSGAEVYRIAATDGAAGDSFGSALAAAGDRILVGAPSHGGGGVQRGGVYRLSFPPYQPDGTVGATAAKLAGRGVHNPSGAGQTLNLISKKLRKVKGIVTATNDGLATDSLLVRGTAGNKLFKVAYFTASGPRANVTGAMSKGGTVLANLASGEVRHYSIEIAPQKKGLQKKKKNGKKVILKKKYNGRVTLSSQNAPAKTDVVIYRVQTK